MPEFKLIKYGNNFDMTYSIITNLEINDFKNYIVKK